MRLFPRRSKTLPAFAVAFFIFGCGADVSGGADVDGGVELADRDMVMGEAGAPVTIIEYASVTCSHCATFHKTVLPELKEKYVDTGQVRFVFREFPTAPGNLALAGFALARCVAEDRGATGYFAMIDALLRKQDDWVFTENDRKQALMTIAASAGMDAAAFDACIENSDETIAAINATVDDAIETYDIQGTPAFVINGERFDGARSIEGFDAVLEPLLSSE